ncbi:unnamed protein product [Didymodactylos carnosus]|uniref:MAM domain-containing protein n=1 Tax=Didymodactylos carnosus TaxID=1234261 RepID=A0A814QAK9_9BILA|nr:unnamed protein product [Didymodactylos carnosus]CAF1116553.1 unnamed protein product [Didymodactylos carnosus]CAF3606968.1 unnamed protein product [Didymodactylos carnosus]CAF3880376.1 unnamed protein product [Didymodactylos carnosus]
MLVLLSLLDSNIRCSCQATNDSVQEVSCSFELDFCQWNHDLTADLNWVRHNGSTPSADTGPQSDIAVDELRLSDGECPEIIPEIHNGNCSFERNLCDWTHDPTAQFSWTRQYGETHSFETGPVTGADNSSAYIFIEASFPQKICDRAGLMSPLIVRPTTTSGAQCFSFFYHMYGINIGSLLIWTIENMTTSAEETLIWQQHGAQGNEWLIKRINLWPTADYYFRIDGYVGDGFEGDIAVDEITLFDGECTEAIVDGKTGKVFLLTTIKLGYWLYIPHIIAAMYDWWQKNVRPIYGALSTVKVLTVYVSWGQ